MKKKVTLKDLAARANVSPASVSMILNQKSIERFSQETVRTVLNLAETMGYQQHKVKQFALVKPADNLIVIVCPSLFNPFYTTIIQGIEIAARQLGYITSVRTTYWDTTTERLIMEESQKLNVAGLIFAMIPQQPELACQLSQQLPVVAIGDRRNDLELATVDMNNFRAGQILGRHLMELGHRHVAYLSTTLNAQHSSRVRRSQGLQAACQEAGGKLVIITQDVTPEHEITHVDVEYTTGYQLAQTCLKEAPQTTAMVAINDMVAYGVYNAVIDAGLRVPEDVSVAGFDNIFPSRIHGLDLTTIDNSLVECGKSAFHLLQEEMVCYDQQGNFSSITHVEYKCKLVPRRSTSTPPTTK